jgi:hypothetical protein
MAIPLGPGDKALSYALGGVMRGGVGRAGAVDGRVYLAIDGVQHGWARDAEAGTLVGSLSISDILDETPNTCSFRVNGAVPATGAELVLTLGSQNRLERLFAGYALTVQQVYAGVPRNVQADVAAVDYTWLLGFTKVTEVYSNQTASAIIRDLVTRYAGVNGFTATAVAELPVLDEITFTNEDLPTAITRTVRRVGAYWFVDYLKNVHAFVEEVRNGAPQPIVPSHTSMTRFSKQGETTQAISRVYVEGRGSRILASVNAGEDRIPVESVDMFAASSDVFLKCSFQGAEGGAQHLTFTGVIPGATGTLVGPGSTPGNAPTLAVVGGGAVEIGTHDYAYSWVTAAGETKPSAAARIVCSTLPTPTRAPGLQHDTLATVDPRNSYAWRPGDTVEWAYSYNVEQNNILAQYQTPLSPIGAAVAIASQYHYEGTAPGSNATGFTVQLFHSQDPNVKWISVWNRINGGPWRMWLSPSIQNKPSPNYPNDPEWYWYTFVSYNQPANYSQPGTPATSAPVLRTVNASGIAVGPATVTGRKVYRTKANLTQLQLLATLADNTATTYTDTAADATLGANAPAGDTSGLPQPTGQIQPGATSIIVASSAPFRSDGGWAVLGNGDQVVRYTGISGGAITGIPPTGRGALTAVVVYNTTITAAPMLTGIPATGTRAIRRPLTAGDEVYLVVQVDNEVLQGNLAALLNVASGVREEWVQDRRLSIAEARARGQATLQLHPLEAVSVEYTCRDLLTAAGKTIEINLPAPTNVTATLKIQAVTIRNFRPRAEQHPTYAVQASSSRFSFEDLLNRFRVKE